MLLESLSRIATETPFTIAQVPGNRLFVLLDGDQDWRRGGGQDDGGECLFEKRNKPDLQNSKLVPLSLCAHRPDGGGLLEKMPDGGLLAGWGRALLGQILRDESRLFRSAKLSRRNRQDRHKTSQLFHIHSPHLTHETLIVTEKNRVSPTTHGAADPTNQLASSAQNRGFSPCHSLPQRLHHHPIQGVTRLSHTLTDMQCPRQRTT